MRIAMIGGTGYVGLVTGAGFASMGHDVICADVNFERVQSLDKGIVHIHEEGLDGLIRTAKVNNRISFTTSIETAVQVSDIIMITVGTPQKASGDTDMGQLLRSLKMIADYSNGNKIVVIKSTVPPGTCDMADGLFRSMIKAPGVDIEVASNPEFLREGCAVSDFLEPERIVIGTRSKKALKVLMELYRSFNCDIIETDPVSSEMIKYACNAYLATRLSFINEIAEICEKVYADIGDVIKGMKYDKRIGGHYLSPGPGFGGPCLQKDLTSLINFSERSGANADMLNSVLLRNELQLAGIIEYIECILGSYPEKIITILGLSFKAGSNDIRNSPALSLIEKISSEDYTIKVYDPLVKDIDGDLANRITFSPDLISALDGSDCMVIMTEWSEFKDLDYLSAYNIMRTPIIVDTRNILDKDIAREHGFIYKGIGINSSFSGSPERSINSSTLPL
jgi:UDPglucose 6-dehydrogenase